jgi:Trp operon repressor
MKDSDNIRILHELIAALDRRVPQMHDAGEASIAREAAALKVSALERVAALEHKVRSV